MAKIISQETFDEVVKENVMEFAMNVQEAKEETVQQFEAQGINLANIIKDLRINEKSGNPVLNDTIDQLKHIAAGGDYNVNEVCKLLDTLFNECKISVPHRVVSLNHRFIRLNLSEVMFKMLYLPYIQMAAKLGAVEIIIDVVESALKQQEAVEASVKMFYSESRILVFQYNCLFLGDQKCPYCME